MINKPLIMNSLLMVLMLFSYCNCIGSNSQYQLLKSNNKINSFTIEYPSGYDVNVNANDNDLLHIGFTGLSFVKPCAPPISFDITMYSKGKSWQKYSNVKAYMDAYANMASKIYDEFVIVDRSYTVIKDLEGEQLTFKRRIDDPQCTYTITCWMVTFDYEGTFCELFMSCHVSDFGTVKPLFRHFVDTFRFLDQ